MTTTEKLSSTATPRDKLRSIINSCKLFPFPHHSRVHPLRSFAGQCYVKREDELGFGISGTKLRKYLSLLPAILEKNPKEAVVIGSAYSNHVLSIAQLLRENGIEPILFLLGDQQCKLQGNLLYATLVSSLKNIHWIGRGKWHEVDALAENYAKGRENAIVVPKGANCPESLCGALTLALDILRNEEELGITFEQIFIDSGTGMTVSALLLAFAYLKKPTFVHVVQIADTPDEFYRVLPEKRKEFEALLGEKVPSPSLFKLYRPTIAPGFGTTNATLFQTIASLAQNEGFLTDPVFTAKLFYEGKKILSQHPSQGNTLFIHSGGGLGLTGFQEDLAKTIHK
jgi:1-aminocyclopropane-1-carboxylate deaminase